MMKTKVCLILLFFFSSNLFAQPALEASQEKTSMSSLEVSKAPALDVKTYTQLVHAILETRTMTEERTTKPVDTENVQEAWEIGGLIQQHILNNDTRAEYEKKLVKKLSKDLKIGKAELNDMLVFARTYAIVPAPGQLSWSLHRELLLIGDPAQRAIFAEKAQTEKWTRERLREEIKLSKKAAKGNS